VRFRLHRTSHRRLSPRGRSFHGLGRGLGSGLGSGLAVIAALGGLASTAVGQLRVVNYNVARLIGDTQAMKEVFTAIADDDKQGYALAPAIFAFQEVRTAERPILEALIASALPGVTYATATFTSSPSEDSAGGAMMLLYRADLLNEVVAGHADIFVGAGRSADRWQLRLDGYDSPLATLWVYGMHLKAGSSASDKAIRLTGAQAIRDNADLLPAGAHVLYSGDFNLSDNTEPAYFEFLAIGAGQAFDPLGTGPWSGVGNAIKHTQSPRDIIDGGLIGGGMDDRFDFQLPSTELGDGQGLSIISGTYRSFGNDGQHYNTAINAGNNVYFPGDIARSNAIADDLFDASDHIPVLVEYQVPAVMSAAIQEDFGRVITGASTGVEVLVANIASVATPLGVDTLTFTAEGVGGAVVGSVSGSVEALPDLASVELGVDASSLGFVDGVALVTATSEAAANESFILFTSGYVLRHANGSVVAGDDVDVAAVEVSVAPDSGLVEIVLPIHNFGFDSPDAQALLDVDSIDGLGDRFDLVPPLPTSIGAVPGDLRVTFDTTGARGAYAAALTLVVTDEDLPGATFQVLGILLDVLVEAQDLLGDLDGNGTVDGADLGLLLSAWGRCPRCIADLDGDGEVNGADLGILLSAWS